MKRVFALVTLVVCAAPVAAQPYAPTFFATGPYMHAIDGSTSTVRQLFSGIVNAYDVTMDLDNRRVVFTANQASSGFPAGVYRYDPTSQVVETLYRDTNLIARPNNIAFDGDGCLWLSTTTFGSDALLKLAPDYSSHTVVAVPSPLAPGKWSGGMRVDLLSGHMVLEDQNAPEPLLAIDPTGTIRTLGTGFDSRGSIAQDLTTGAWFCSGYRSVHRLDIGQSTSTFVTSSSSQEIFDALDIDRSSASSPVMHVCNYYGLMTVDLNTRTVVQKRAGGGLSYKTGLVIYGRRNLASRRVAPLDYRFDVSFPSHPGKTYAVAMSLTGAGLRVPLPDGRAFAIIPDALTALSVGGGIPPLLSGSVGALDAGGRAQMRLDVRALPAVAGVRVWAQPIVFDPAASLGMAVIGDPIGVTLR